MLEKSDIIEIDITQDMIFEARADAEFLKQQIGRNTRNVIENRDIIGSLAHQVVELAFQEMEVYHISYRTKREKIGQGDLCDIEYEHDFIDVKGTHGVLDQWYYNKNFLVFSKQLEAEKMEKITHFIFVLVHPDLSRAWIFGEISVSEFRKLGVPVNLQYDNIGIKAKHLYSLRNYVYRSGPR